MGAGDMQDPFAKLEEDSLVPESAFDQAFAQIGALDRAWMKQNIAQLHSIHALPGWSTRREDRSWSNGFWSRLEQRPVERTAVCFPSHLLASPRLVAAVLPPLAVGVKRCCAVRVGAKGAAWDPRLLAALELAGMEEVFDPDQETFQAWMGLLGDDPGTRLVFLEDLLPGQDLGTRSGNPFLLPTVEKIGLWFQEREQWDQERLKASHPRARVYYGGPAAPEAASPREQTLSSSRHDFFAPGFDALYVPPSMFEEALSRCPRVFGPGQEGCWIWPELGREPFLQTRLCLSRSDPIP